MEMAVVLAKSFIEQNMAVFAGFDVNMNTYRIPTSGTQQ